LLIFKTALVIVVATDERIEIVLELFSTLTILGSTRTKKSKVTVLDSVVAVVTVVVARIPGTSFPFSNSWNVTSPAAGAVNVITAVT
jgi:hypothetical protein